MRLKDPRSFVDRLSSGRPALACVAVLLLAASGCSLGGSSKPAEQEAETGSRALTVISALPRQGREKERTDAMVTGIKAAIAARDGKAGDYQVRYVDADDTTEESGGQENEETCEAFADRVSEQKQVVAVIGPLSPACARLLVPGLNRAGVAVVSPTVDLAGLTHQVPGNYDEESCFECSPAPFYPSGVRNFARAIATQDSEGRAAADLMRRLGARSAYIIKDEDSFSTPLQEGFVQEAKRRGLAIVGKAIYTFQAKSYEDVARELTASGADALYLLTDYRADEIFKAVRGAGFDGTIVDRLPDESILTSGRGAVEGAYFTSARLPLVALPEEAERFAAAVGAGQFSIDAVYAAEAANVALDAIAASDGTRPGVREALFRVSRTGLLGPISIDENGDAEPARVAVFRARRGEFVYRETITLRGG